MIHRRTYTIREWDRIEYGDGEKEIPQAHADQIAAQARASAFSGSNGEGVLEHRREDLRARGVVGIIAARDCQLEILPKIEGANEKNGADNSKLRERLIHMLAQVWDIRIDAGDTTRLAWQRDTILELLIRLFCGKLTDAVRQGVPQQYTNEEDDLPALRGRLDAIRQFTVLAASPQKLACRFDARSPDIALNQVMRAAIDKLRRLAQAPDNQRALRELSFYCADVSPVPPRALRWDLIALDRTNTRWRELLSLARLFLGDRHQQTSAGAIDGHALLFEMNVLFEKYAAKLLARALARTNLSVQGKQLHCLFKREAGRFLAKPDLIVWKDNKAVTIIDTKWKRIRPRSDDLKRGVSQADVYQLMAYSQIYKCPHVVLLYPHHGGLQSNPILEQYSIARQGAKESLFAATLDLTKPESQQRETLLKLVRDHPNCDIAA